LLTTLVLRCQKKMAHAVAHFFPGPPKLAHESWRPYWIWRRLWASIII
jgi:hypothetical protein